MNRKLVQRSAVAVAATALAASTSALFGGAAFAGGGVDVAGSGGPGGTNTVNCPQIPVLSGDLDLLNGVASQGTATATQTCAQSANGGHGGSVSK